MMRTKATDGELLLHFLNHNDQRAFAELMRRYSSVVIGVCSAVLRNRQDAEDAYQEVFITLARKAGDLRRKRSLGGWLYRVAQRVAIRHAKRRRSNDNLVELADETSCPLEAVAKREAVLLLIDEITGLPERYRDVVVLCHLQGWSRKRAAGQLDCTDDAVKSRLARARKILRLRLARRGVTMSIALSYLSAACCREVNTTVLKSVAKALSSRAPSDSYTRLRDRIVEIKPQLAATSVMASLAIVWAAAQWSSHDAGARETAKGLPTVAPRHDEMVQAMLQVSAPKSRDETDAGDERWISFEKLRDGGDLPDYWKQVTGNGDWIATHDFCASGASAIHFTRPNMADRSVDLLLLNADHVRYRAVEISLRLRLNETSPTSGGGVVWGYTDERNFLSVGLSSKGVVEVYRTLNGKRDRLLTAGTVVTKDEIHGENWPRLRVVHAANELIVFVNDRRLLSARLQLPAAPAMVGIMALGHDVGFDDFRVKTAANPIRSTP